MNVKDFRGKKLPESEVKVLEDIEDLIGKKLDIVDSIDWRTVGIKIKNERVIGIGFSYCGLSAIPKSIIAETVC